MKKFKNFFILLRDNSDSYFPIDYESYYESDRFYCSPIDGSNLGFV